MPWLVQSLEVSLPIAAINHLLCCLIKQIAILIVHIKVKISLKKKYTLNSTILVLKEIGK
jgi:hypothetical protein